MGLSRTVHFATGLPSWEALRDHLDGRGIPLQLRMIDGQLAFPDEAPSAEWTELRVSLPQGMITLRRVGDDVAFVIWGNAEPGLVEAWNELIGACGDLGGTEVS